MSTSAMRSRSRSTSTRCAARARACPTLVEMLRRHGVHATFLFSLGPDHTGRAIKRVFRPGFVGKVRRTSVVKHYGVSTLLYGTLLPGPDIGRRAGDVMQGVRDAGHETGVHCWDHIRWQDGVASADERWTHAEMQRACERYTDIFREPPRTHGAAGWQMNVHALRLTQRLGFDYCSDGRGTHPHLPIFNARADPLPAVSDDAADARRAGRPRRHDRRQRRGASARAHARPRRPARCSRCTPSSRACGSRRVRAAAARLEGAGLDARSGALALRARRADGAAALRRRARAPWTGAPARCSCKARNSWATSTSRRRMLEHDRTRRCRMTRQESGRLQRGQHQRHVQAVRPQGPAGRPLLLPEGQHAGLHDRRRAVPRCLQGSSARRARRSSACRATRSSRTKASRPRWSFRSSSSPTPTKSCAQQFDVIKMKNMYGKQVRGIERSDLSHRRRRASSCASGARSRSTATSTRCSPRCIAQGRSCRCAMARLRERLDRLWRHPRASGHVSRFVSTTIAPAASRFPTTSPCVSAEKGYHRLGGPVALRHQT